MKDDMSFIVNKNMNDYRSSVKSVLGWEDEDLRQHIRILLWKGVVTFDESLGFKITSYLSTILYRGMSNISKACKTKKAEFSKMHLVEDLDPQVEVGEFSNAFGSSEDWMDYSQQFSVLMGSVNKEEMRVLIAHLIHGNTLGQMQKKFGMSRTDVIRIIKNIQEKMERHFGGAA